METHLAVLVMPSFKMQIKALFTDKMTLVSGVLPRTKQHLEGRAAARPLCPTLPPATPPIRKVYGLSDHNGSLPRRQPKDDLSAVYKIFM